MTDATETAYQAMFPTADAATEYENQVLSIGREFLPECAELVLDGGDATPEYWGWLCDQVE